MPTRVARTGTLRAVGNSLLLTTETTRGGFGGQREPQSERTANANKGMENSKFQPVRLLRLEREGLNR